MLARFRTQNFRSLRDSQELSFVSDRLSAGSEHLLETTASPSPLLPVVAIYGANASGKSSVLMALEFMEKAVLRSQRAWAPEGGVPTEPFALDLESAADPSLFEVDLVLDDVRYTYGFEANAERVLKEWLYAYPDGHRQKWFVRSANATPEFRFSKFLKGENQAIQRLTRPNSLFLSAAAQNNHAALMPVFEWFQRRIHFVRDRSGTDRNTISLLASPEGKEAVLELMRMADLGLTSVAVEQEAMPDLAKDLLKFFEGRDPEFASHLSSSSTVPIVKFGHRSAMSSSTPTLALKAESQGTQALFALAGFLLRSLSVGSLLVIDELDTSIHPLVAQRLVQLYCDPDSNTRRAQLLFTTHDVNLLDSRALRRDQVWFTEKSNDGTTELYPLSDFKARKQENLKRGYLQGRYGAIPLVADANFSALLARPDADQ